MRSQLPTVLCVLLGTVASIHGLHPGNPSFLSRDSNGHSAFKLPQWSGDAAPTLENVNPWATPNGWTAYGSITTALLGIPFPASEPIPASLGVDPVKKIWAFNGTTEAQWAFADSAYVLQGGACWEVEGWNFAKQVAGYNSLQNVAQNRFLPLAFGAAFDIASCGCQIANSFQLVNISGNLAVTNWGFQQAFPDLPAPFTGIGGDLYFDRFDFSAPPASMTTLPAACLPPLLQEAYYCEVFTAPSCTFIPEP